MEGRKMDFKKFFASFVCALVINISAFVTDTMALVPAFPGAEGSGCWATGGRGGTVYEVTNLNNSGAGSIVDAVSAGNRTIVFRVSGTISLGDTILKPKSNTTIAGQTAPGDGICIKGRIQIGTKSDPAGNVDNIIIRYIRIRVDKGGANSSGDAIDIAKGSNIIIDHVSASYSRDEAISCQEASDNVTVQWCIMSEALNYENHSYGSLIRGQYGQEKTYHHNLYAHNRGRNPRPGSYIKVTDDPNDPEGLHFDFRNNVIYNWQGSVAGNNDDSSSSLSVSRYNFIGNVYISGAESSGTKAFRERSRVSYGYFADNSHNGTVSPDPWSIVNFDSSYMTTDDITAYKARSYLLPMEPVTTTSSAQAKIDVLADAGASFPSRDSVDTRITNDVLNLTGHIILDTNESTQPAGGWWPTLNSLGAPKDSDHDGMPDKWETLHRLNPNNANDRNNYNLDDDYTNLEIYLNSLLTQEPVPPRLDWTKTYNGTASGSDYAKDIAVDSTGNVYVTGYGKNTATDYDFVTRKYTPAGNTVWTRTYNYAHSSLDYAKAMTLDKNSNIIVAGFSYTAATGCDGTIVKYSPSGSQLLARAYNYSGTSDERLYDVATDAGGNICAVGRTGTADCLVIKYTSDGTLAWAKTYNGSAANSFDSLYQLAIDAAGNIYACGESTGTGTDQDCLTLKYSPAGTLLWAKTYNGPANGWDLLEAIALDSAGNVYVTGSVETASDSNYMTIKYSPAGNRLWTASYTNTAPGWDESYAIAVTPDSNIVVTGYSEGITTTDAATVKYNSQTGSQIWANKYSSAEDSINYAEAIATDSLGNIYVHGRNDESGSIDYLTICYNSDGAQQWKINYDGPASLTDAGCAIAVDNNGIVYATGSSQAANGTYDYATIKYTQHNYCPGDMEGDLNGDCIVNFFDFAMLAESYLASVNDYLILNDMADAWLSCGMLIPEECYSIAPADTTPQNLMVPPMAWDDTQIILIWSKPQDYSQVANYMVYQNGAELGLSGRFDTTRPKLYYNVTGLTPNTAYNFTVKSILSNGWESPHSNICYKTTANTPAVFYPETYGAAADGITKDTAAIQAAINACTAGGKVHLQAGKTFLSGAVFLKSNMTLQIDGTLLGSKYPADYPYTSLRFPYYATGNNYMGLVNAYYDYNDPTSAGRPYGSITNVRICGSGVINGCEGYSASDPHYVNVNTGTLTKLGSDEKDLHDTTNRGDMVTIKGVNQVYLGGWGGPLTMVFPAEHTIFVSYCNGVTVADVNCDTYDIANGDGIDLCTTDTAYIFNSKFDTGDDCINMNAGQGLEGVNENVPTQNVRVFDCSTDRGHGGYVIGSFTAAWVQDSLIEDCFFKNFDTSNGIAIRMKTGNNNGGGARRITCRDIRISGCSRQGIFLDSTYNQTDYGDAGPGQFSGNTFKNITVSTTSYPSIYVNGVSGTPHTNNIFDHITGNKAASLNYCTNSTFSYVTVTGWSPYTNCSGNINGGNNSPVPPF